MTNYSILLAALSGLHFLISCSGSDFTGGGKQKTSTEKPALAASPQPSSATSLPPANGGIGTTGSGAPIDSSNQTGGTPGTVGTVVEESVTICKEPAGVADPVASFTFASNNELRPFINGFVKYTRIRTAWAEAGGLFADKITADAVCRLKGYKESTSFTPFSYHSCGDNYDYPWDEAKKDFVERNACAGGNKHLRSIVCGGLLKAICGKDPTWVFGRAATN